MMPTLEDALLYMGIDVTDDPVINANAARCLSTAKQILFGAVGEDLETYLPSDPRALELVLVYTEDLYSQRGMASKVSGATRRSVSNMLLQLQTELQAAKEAAAV